MVRLTDGSLTKGKVKTIAHLAKSLERIYSKSGNKGLCLYLKTCSVLLMQSVPNSGIRSSSREISKVAVATTRRGIPRIIPRDHRSRIASGDGRYYRLWLTLFGLYRVLAFPGKLTVQTIVTPGKSIPAPVWGSITKAIPRFVRKLEEETGLDLLGRDPEKELKLKILSISSSGANSSYGTTSFAARKMAAWLWVNDRWGSALWQYLWCLGETEGTKSFWQLIQSEACYQANAMTCNGRLSTKQEPAGKVRVFAMVDYWTQCALAPLHDYLMGILKDISQDGTFNQSAPLERLLKRLPADRVIYSYDLTAATDRLSVAVQERLLRVMFTEGLAWSWRRLLVDRTYRLPKGERYLGKRSVKYAVGQPMGAYSSWAMLALTHHFLIQWASELAGMKGWFKDYAILGDDLVIANDKVAAKYLCICRWIGLGIGISKSLVAPGAAEFAKRFYLKGSLWSPTPWKLFGVTMSSMNGALGMLQWMKACGIKSTLSNALLAVGVGMKNSSRISGRWEVLPRRLQALLVVLTHPSANTPYSRSNWIEWLSSSGPLASVKYSDETLVSFTKWSQALYDEYILPMEKRLDEVKSALLFTTEVETPAEVMIGVNTFAKITKFEDAWTKSSASLRHLQSLKIKLQARQASAVFEQVVKLLENRLAEIPLVPADLALWKDKDENRAPRLTQVFSLWKRWTRRAENTLVKDKVKLDESDRRSER